MESFRQQAEELQEEVSRLCCVREGEQEIEYCLRLQEEMLGPVVTSKDYQTELVELQQRTDITLEKEAPWFLVTPWEQVITSPPSFLYTTQQQILNLVSSQNL